MMKIRDAEFSRLNEKENYFCHILFFGSDKLDDVKNTSILNATTEYILSTERFTSP